MIAGGGLSGGISSTIAGGDFWKGMRQGLIISGLNHSLHMVVQESIGRGIIGTNGKRIDYTENSDGTITWTSNTPAEFQEMANEYFKSPAGKTILDMALNSDTKIFVKVSNEVMIEDDGSYLFGYNSSGATTSIIDIYKGSFQEVYTKYGSNWEVSHNGMVTNSGELSLNQNMAITLGHEFMHTLDKVGSSHYFSKRKSDEREIIPRFRAAQIYNQFTGNSFQPISLRKSSLQSIPFTLF